MHNSFIHSVFYHIVRTPSLARRPAAHLTTKRQILLFHTHNRPIQTTCWRHITLHVKLQPNALIDSHKSPSLRTTHTCTIAKLPHCLTSRKIRHGCYQLSGGCVLLGTTCNMTRENKSRYNSVRLLRVTV